MDTLSVSTKVCLFLHETRQPPPFRRMLRMNSPEWSFIAIGCVAAMVTGALQPCFAIIFAEIMGVSNFYLLLITFELKWPGNFPKSIS